MIKFKILRVESMLVGTHMAYLHSMESGLQETKSRVQATKELRNALKAGKYNAARLAIEQGTNVNDEGVLPIVNRILELFSDIVTVDPETIGQALDRAALKGHDDVFQALFNDRAASIAHNADLWLPYLEEALFHAAIQGSTRTNPEERKRYFTIVEFILNQDFLSMLDIAVARALSGLEELAHSTQGDFFLKEIAALQKRLSSHQSAQERIRAVRRSAIQETSLLGTLPEELIYQRLAPFIHAGFHLP